MSDTLPESEDPQDAEAVETPEVGGTGETAEAVGTAEAVESGPEYEPRCDPAAPAPLNVPRTPTGNPEVDVQLERLADADHLATDGHVEVYEDVHRGLRDALTALDARPGPPAPAPSYQRTPAPPYQSRS